MKKFSLVSSFILVALFTTTGFAGGSEGVGGGGGMSCLHGTHAYTRFLDFYEAEHLFGFHPYLPALNYKFSDGPMSSDDLRAEPFLEFVRQRLMEVLQNKNLVDRMLLPASFVDIKTLPTTGLPYETNDLGAPMVETPNGCRLIQLAIQKMQPIQSTPQPPQLSLQVTKGVHLIGQHDLSGLFLHEILHYWFFYTHNTRSIRLTTMYLAAPDAFRERNRELMRKVILEFIQVNPEDFH